MPSPKFPTIAKQVTDHIREGLSSGHWRRIMPGRNLLAQELGVSPKTVDLALKKLESEGLLLEQGPGRRRLIANVSGPKTVRSMRVALQLSASVNRSKNYIIRLERELKEAGHSVIQSARPLIAMGMDLERIRRLVEATEADGWVILSGSRSVLEWFAARPEPSFAFFGRRDGLSIAGVGPNKVPAFVKVTRELIDLGHRRVTLLARSRRRLPKPGRS